MTELRTSRLILRPARPEDAPCFALGVSDFAVARWLTPLPFPFTLAMASDWLRAAPSDNPDKSLFIVDLPGRGLVGCVAIGAELGFWIAKRHWGQGFGTEAASAVIDWHFTRTTSDAIVSSAHHDNRASLRLKAKLGFVETGRDMRFSHALQHNVPHVLTRLDRETWRARAEQLCA
ncbi:Protein N-acetyltransferase, RimJ/RimL family [Devosia lucknowensis]|uniref:Protein N-acetyltransferase, RimJ/RimL family n=1 Tax=Devosia lucknowensis TaxID=1096929 RepID=A0A1Y6G7S6_9HYPH|nr:GNAT family N-acetyltransferase [Devosia lucknowensis]SMQ86165.1 Protein N-acetyltransferase, RimJ/RimL family [Devosia lucknowensis]